jgi:hypothetical protein
LGNFGKSSRTGLSPGYTKYVEEEHQLDFGNDIPDWYKTKIAQHFLNQLGNTLFVQTGAIIQEQYHTFMGAYYPPNTPWVAITSI